MAPVGRLKIRPFSAILGQPLTSAEPKPTMIAVCRIGDVRAILSTG